MVAGFVVGALALRLVQIGRNSLWSDEAFSWYFASKDVAEIWANGGPDAHHPPLYHTLLHWVMQASETEAALRFPSAVASALTVGVIFLLAERLAGRSVAFLAALLALVSPLDIWYAQEARQAAVGTLFTTLAAYSLTRGDVTGRVTAVLSLVAAFFTYYISFLVWAMVLGVAIAIGWRRSQAVAREWVVATIPALVIFVPIQGRHFVEGFSDLQASIGQPFLESLISTTGSPLTLLILVAVGAAALTAVVRWLLEAAPVFAASVTTAAFVLGVIAGPVDRIYRFKRITVVFWPLVIVFVAYAIYRGFSKSVSRLVQISLVAISIIASLLTLFVVEKDDWRSAVSAINEGSDPDDSIWMVYYVDEWSVAPYDYYGAKLPLLFSVDENAFPELAASAAQNDLLDRRQPNTPGPCSVHGRGSLA